MSCDGLYLISLKGPQATAAARQGNACVGPCTLSCCPPPFFLTQTKRRTRDADGMESLAMQSILLGARQGGVVDPRRGSGSRIRTRLDHSSGSSTSSKKQGLGVGEDQTA